MNSKRIEGLPFLPGNTFVDPTQADFRKSQTFFHKNGFLLPKDDYLGVGNVHIPTQCLSVKDLFDMYNYDPQLTYGVPKRTAPKPFIPPFVTLEKKTLKFTGYYKESVTESNVEIFRVRAVNIFYYLEDDSIMVDEPRIDNSGLMQGRLLRRHRIPKNDLGEFWHWKDLNIACDVMFYGRVIRIVDCDKWTKKFYEEEGMLLNDPEVMPQDPYTEKRFQSLQKRKFQTPDVMLDTRKKFMEFGQRILKFKCVWDDRHNMYGGLGKYELYYHLEDDKVEVMEIHYENNGKDPLKLLLHKTRLPKDWKDLPLQFPIISMEPSKREIVEYYEPKDFKIGETINVFGRRFLIYDMDECTKQFYREHFGYTDFTPICVDIPKAPRPEAPLPPWNGWGSPEDSLMSCLHIVPQRPRYDAKKRLVFELKVLKFGAVMDSTRPEDQGREFTISYRLVDDKISVYERPVRNSGWPSGKFLDYCRVMKPGSSKDNPEYYGPHDLYIGAMLDIFNSRFCINSADRFVMDFINANPDCFPEFVRNNIKEYFDCLDVQSPLSKQEKPCDPGTEVCEEPLGEGFFEKLGMGSQKFDDDPCADNPNPCPMQYDWDMCRQLGYNCGVQREPYGPDDLEPIDQVCEKPCPGNADLFETKDVAVCQPQRYVAPDPIPPNPKLVEEAECIPPEKYEDWKQRRFDCFNPPGPDRQYDQYMKQQRFGCPCPPEELQTDEYKEKICEEKERLAQQPEPQ